MFHIVTCNQLFFLDAFFLYIVLFLLLVARILVLFKTQYTQGSAASKEVRSSGLQVKLKFWHTPEAQALTTGAALANAEALASFLVC
jgi:hypothetical protein